MDGVAGHMFAAPAGDVGEARPVQHRFAFAAGIVHHADLVVAEGDVEAHQRDAETVDLVGVQADAIILIGQAFAERAHAEFPRTIAAHTVLHRRAEAPGRQRIAPRAALIAIAALEPHAFLAADIAEARDINPARAAAIFDKVGHPGYVARNADAENMRSAEHTSELQSLMRNSYDV